jgi:nucleotide-binding universal stress UspA family protein
MRTRKILMNCWREETFMAFGKILIAVDSEQAAARAAEIGAELASLLGAQVALIHSVAIPVSYAAEDAAATEELIARAIRDGERLLRSFHQRVTLPAATSDYVECGQPAARIVEIAKRWPADLIVMGSHGRGGVQRMLLGSVAEEVMRHAPCPVLIAPASV